MNTELLEKIKKLTISGLLADDLLMGVLVLKGGNALGIAYDITNRGSIDIDFSMEKDFTDNEKRRIGNQVSYLLNDEFNKEGLQVIDVKFFDKPEKIDESVKNFWGGYKLEFKIVPMNVYLANKDNPDALRRLSVSLTKGDQKTYSVDISKYEYIGKARPKEIDGTVAAVYSPEMLALEKLRAICQQNPQYKKIIFSMHGRPRARDFYDIYNLAETFKLDFETKENKELLNLIFQAKKVPLNFICQIEEFYDFHFGSWETVLQTIDQREAPREFQFYFDFVIEKFLFNCT